MEQQTQKFCSGRTGLSVHLKRRNIRIVCGIGTKKKEKKKKYWQLTSEYYILEARFAGQTFNIQNQHFGYPLHSQPLYC
jgi:hypothetical protein